MCLILVEVCSEQSSILRCNIETLGCVAFNVSYASKVCFILLRRLVSRARCAQQNRCPTTSYVGLHQLLRSSARRTETTPLVCSILQPNFGPGSARICWAIRMRPGIGTSNLERLTIYPRIGGNGPVPADERSQSLASCSWLAPKYRISIPEFRSKSLSVS